MVLFAVIFLFKFAEKAFNKKIAVLSSILLITNPIFFIASRQARIDIGVVTFTLGSLLFYLLGKEKKNTTYFLASGLFAGFAFITHLNGILTIIALYIFLLFDKNLVKKETTYASLGAVLGLIPYLMWIYSDSGAYVTQMTQMYGNRMSILDSGFWVKNIVNEFTRYSAIRTVFGLVPLLLLGAFSFKRNKYLFIHVMTYFFGLWLLISNKTGAYLIYLVPALCIFSGVTLQKTSIKKIVAIFLILLNISVISYWFVTYHDREYYDVTAEISVLIDDNPIVLAEPRFWLSTRPQPFYSIHHLKLSNLTLNDAFSKNKVNTVIVDFFVRSFMNENKELLIQDTIHTHCHKTKEFVDPLYPKENIEIYRCNI